MRKVLKMSSTSVIILAVLLTAGCELFRQAETSGGPSPLAQQVADTKTISDQIKQKVDDLKTQIAENPATQPAQIAVQQQQEAALNKLSDLQAKANQALELAQQAAAAAQTGDTTQLQKSVSALPGPVGVYGGLGIALAGLVVQTVRQIQTKQALDIHKKALDEVVTSVDTAIPVKTPEVKAALDRGQSKTTQRLVDDIKSS